MEIRSLRYFIAVVEEANITRAAERLNMSQPPLTHQIQMLEQELGVQLLIRGKRRVSLTPEGAILFRRAKEILELEEKTGNEIREMRNGMSGTLDLGLVEGRAPFLAAKWIAGFGEEFPNVRFNLWNGSTDDVLERLYKGLADLAVIAKPYDTERLDGIYVGNEPWVAIIPKNHPLAAEAGNSIFLSKLVGERLIVPARKSRMKAIRHWFEAVQADPYFFCETSNYLDALALTEQGAGISIFPQTVYTPNELVVCKELLNPHPIVEYDLVWPNDRHLNELSEEFLNYVKDYMEEDMGDTM